MADRSAAKRRKRRSQTPRNASQGEYIDGATAIARYGYRTEREWLNHVVETAEKTQWEYTYHTHDSRKSPAGMPDLMMIRPPRLLYAELKLHPATQKRGRPSPAQERVLELLRACGVEAYVWRPSDIDEVERILR